MSTLKKLHLYIAAIILTFSASYACDCEKKNSVFDFNTLVNIFLGHNEYGEVLGFLSLDVSEDLSGIVKKENFVFPETGHPEKLFGNAEYRKISSRAKNTHILDRQWNELSFKNKKLFLSELSSFDIAKFKGLGKSDTLESKGDVKILSAKLVDSSSKMPLREYTVTGGFKRNENGAYLDKSSLKDSYFYEINVYAEIFTSGGSRKEHMRVFRKYNPDGTFADNLMHFTINGKDFVLEKTKEKYAAKNTGADDCIFDKISTKITSQNEIKIIEELAFKNYKLLKTKDAVSLKQQDFSEEILPLQTKVYNIVPDKDGQTISAQNNTSKEDVKFAYILDQNPRMKIFSGKCISIYRNKRDWELIDYTPVDGKKSDYDEIVYTPLKGAILLDRNNDGQFDVRDLKDTPVSIKRTRHSVVALKVGMQRGKNHKIASEEESHAIATFENGNVSLKNEKKYYKKEHKYEIDQEKKHILKKTKLSLPDKTGELVFKADLAVEYGLKGMIDPDTNCVYSTYNSASGRKTIGGVINDRTVNATSFLDENLIPNYANIPTYAQGSGMRLEYSITGAESQNDISVVLPWDSTATTLTQIELVSGKSILTSSVYDNYDNMIYTAEYVYISDGGSGQFYPISWTYYIFDSYANELGSYQNNGLYSLSDYTTTTVDGNTRYITTTTNQNGVKYEYGYSNSDRTNLLYERKMGVQSSEYGSFNDMLTTYVGDMADFASCGCLSAITDVGDALVSYYNTNSINGSGDATAGATLLYQTYQYNESENKPAVKIDSYGIKTLYVYDTDPVTGYDRVTEVPPGYNSTDNVYKRTIYESENYVYSITGKGIVSEYHTYDYAPIEGDMSETIRYGSPSSERYITKYYEGVNNRLIREDTPTGTKTYEYDANGNITIIGNPNETRTVYTYDVLGNSTGHTTQYFDTTTQTWTNIGTSIVSDTCYIVENAKVWKKSTSAMGAFTTDTREIVGNFYEIENGSVVAGKNVSYRQQYKTEGKMLVNRQNKIIKYVSKSYENSNGAWVENSASESVTLNDLDVSSSTNKANNEIVAATKTYYDNALRISYVENKGKNNELLYTSKNFYYPNSTVSLSPQTGSISVQGKLEAQSVFGTNTIMGRKAEYIANSEKNAGKMKKLIYATSFDSETKKPISGNRVIYEFNDFGFVSAIWGYGQIPSKFAYNEYGQMTDMYLFKLPPGDISKWSGDVWPSDVLIANPNAEHTQWAYNSQGMLVLKKDALNKEESATYDATGKIATISYPDGTNFAYTYDPIDRTLTDTFNEGSYAYEYGNNSNVTKVTYTPNGGSAQIFTYEYSNTNALMPTKECYPDGWSLERTNDDVGNITSVKLKDASGAEKYSVNYSYDSEGRLSNLTANNKTVSYEYEDFGRVKEISLNSLAKISYEYDTLQRIKSMAYSSNNLELRKCTYNLGADEKVASIDVNKNGALYGQWRYTYQNLSSGILSAGLYKDTSSSALFDQYSNYAYAYDTAGNPTSENNSGDISYASNLSNQTTGIARASNLEFPIRGSQGNLSLTVNGTSEYTRDGSFCYGISAYTATPKYEEIKLESKIDNGLYKSIYRGKKYLPEAQESLTYSNSGNLTSDSRWLYGWNSRQRLASVETSPQAIAAGAPKIKWKYEYNWKGLKTKAEKYTWDTGTGTWQLYSTNYRYYDDHNLIYERTEYPEGIKDFYGFQMQTEQNKFYYGLDLLDGIYGTGGTGGVRMANINGREIFAYNDIAGNIEALFSSSDGTSQLAEYEYSPFGEIRVQRGALASTNPLRFSSRYSESETDLYYYSYREYSPRLKKWVCKEPLGEKEDFNLYRFCYNTSFNGIDILGEKYSNLWVGIQPGPHNRPDIPQKNIPKEPNPYDKRSCLSIAVEIGLYFFFYEKAYRAWINYARGMGEDISLSDEEMKSLYNAANYNPETEKDIKDFEEKCAQGKITQKTISGGAYFDKFKDTDWFLTIGGHQATIKISCKKCVAKIESYSVNDIYRFPIDNPGCDFIRKIGDGIARNQERCKWCPFKHIGTYKIP